MALLTERQVGKAMPLVSFLSFLNALPVSSDSLLSPRTQISLTLASGLHSSTNSFSTSAIEKYLIYSLYRSIWVRDNLNLENHGLRIVKIVLTVGDLCCHLVLGDHQVISNSSRFLSHHVDTVSISLHWFISSVADDERSVRLTAVVSVVSVLFSTHTTNHWSRDARPASYHSFIKKIISTPLINSFLSCSTLTLIRYSLVVNWHIDEDLFLVSELKINQCAQLCWWLQVLSVLLLISSHVTPLHQSEARMSHLNISSTNQRPSWFCFLSSARRTEAWASFVCTRRITLH